MAGGVPPCGAAVAGWSSEDRVKMSVWSMAGGSVGRRDGCGAHAVGKVGEGEAREEGWRHKWMEAGEKLLELTCHADCGDEVVKG